MDESRFNTNIISWWCIRSCQVTTIFVPSIIGIAKWGKETFGVAHSWTKLCERRQLQISTRFSYSHTQMFYGKGRLQKRSMCQSPGMPICWQQQLASSNIGQVFCILFSIAGTYFHANFNWENINRIGTQAKTMINWGRFKLELKLSTGLTKKERDKPTLSLDQKGILGSLNHSRWRENRTRNCLSCSWRATCPVWQYPKTSGVDKYLRNSNIGLRLSLLSNEYF